MEITIFKDIKDTSQPFYRDVDVIIERIRDGASKDIIKAIRSEKDKEKRDLLKQQLPAICFSGIFTKRNDKSLTQHSGLICLDFDGYPNNRELLSQKEILAQSKYVYAAFISPSGKGLKAVVKIPPIPENHKNYFNGLEKHFGSKYFDKSCKNVSRVCYESYDPLLYFNENASVWDKLEDKSYDEIVKHVGVQTIPITDENKIVEILVKWWQNKFPMSEGARNNNVYILAAAFNDFGINRNLASYILSSFETETFKADEIKRTIDSAYSNIQNFGTKYYEDKDKVSMIKVKLARGFSKKEIKDQLTDVDPIIAENVVNRIDEEDSTHKFWTKNDKGTIKMVHILFKQFLEDNGFYKFCPQGSKNYVFVKVTNNLIDHTSEKDIKDFILEHLLTVDDSSVYNYFAEHTRYFREDFLTLLQSIEVYFIEDSKDTSYLYYRNGAVKIKEDSVTMIDYIDLGGYVWKDHVIDREFAHCDSIDCDYQKFISNISGGDEERTRSMKSTIGYMLHGWKNLAYCPAVILNDEVISDNPEGGSGKGLWINGLSHMKKVVIIDGKSFNFEKSFAYQLVSADTQILTFDDVRKHFDFERLFSVVTEGLTLEKKNKDAIKIPFSKSPKVAITTNYAIKGKGNSFERRKWELELAHHYNKDYTPLEEFGKMMFGDWNDDEWCQFDNYMIQCLQMYLAKGLIKSTFVNLRIRKLAAETCHEFIEWCGILNGRIHDKLRPGGKVSKSELYHDFIEENPDFAPKSKMTISRTMFGKWVVAFSQFQYDVAPEQGREAKSRWVRFRYKHELEVQTDLF